MNNKNKIGFSIFGFFLFFLTIAGTSSCTVMVFQSVNRASNGNLVAIVFAVLGNILLGTVLCSVIDIFRRKIMVDRPTKKILKATSEIAKGNFDIKLDIKHDHKRFDEYDIIMENINKMAEELSKNEILKTDFISNVSHEIKTPLTIIQNYAKLLSSKQLGSQEREKYLDEICIATKRLGNLVNNILKLNKLENQKLDFETTNFNLGEELRLCVLNFEKLFEEKSLNVVYDIKDICVYSSKELLEIVWNNLLSNAIKFSNQNGTIGVKVFEKNNFAVVEISDTGVGMNDSVGMRIFDKFYQGDVSHSNEGNGLGLALVKKVIDILGGEISVQSEPGKGSVFTIRIKKV